MTSQKDAIIIIIYFFTLRSVIGFSFYILYAH